ncbi:SDR family NAD(P)-dependent oxidoreductase [Aquibacillus sediminis]|uniref:SDR family NAD(P)-dependent oxidoreductase n=1 Tax=Aquibacillus sediminis TaxID=2574734 RepID=UPI00110873A1|nr:glucose 1-dehydrogenase [Aquibacillus sediminis]
MVKYRELFDLTNKTAIVTGGGVGLGKEIANALSQVGANIVIADIDLKQSKETAQEIKELNGVSTLAIKTDVTNEEDVRLMVDKTVENFGKVDILVNNAGICQKIDAVDQSLEDWKKTMDVNVNGVFLCSKYVALNMMENNGGSIINMSSMSGFIANTESQTAYNASKAAVAHMTKSFASEWVNHNIRVNAIGPGYMKTAMTKPIFEEGGELAHVLDMVPVKRLGEPYELGGAVILLASEASSFTTGSTFIIDGGYTIN